MDEAVSSKEEFLKHLDIIQATITRLSSNSFALRGWSVTLVAGLFALAAKDAQLKIAVISYLPVLAFWLLDGYYLLQERQYRKLFELVAARDRHIPAFSLDTNLVSASRPGILKTCFSGTVLGFHAALFVTVTIVTLLLRNAK